MPKDGITFLVPRPHWKDEKFETKEVNNRPGNYLGGRQARESQKAIGAKGNGLIKVTTKIEKIENSSLKYP